MTRSITIGIAFVVLAACRPSPGAVPGVEVNVTGGRSEVTDWIVEASIDLDAVAKTLNAELADVVVQELDEAGTPLAAVSSQIDSDPDGGQVVTFLVPGKTAAAGTRRFVVRLNQPGIAQTVSHIVQPLSATVDNGVVRVVNGPIAIEHVGGMPSRITTGEHTASFSYADRAYDGTEAPRLSGRRTTLLASGPLRVVCETQGTFGRGIDSNPRATYRFTYLAGQPLARVEAVLQQDFAKQWRSVHPIEIQIGGAPVKWFSTDKGGGDLKQAGKFYEGSKWAAAYGEHVLIATLGTSGLGVYDGGGRHYGAYVRFGTTTWSSLQRRKSGAIFIGAGKQDLEPLQQWAAILTEPPSVTTRFDRLERRFAEIAAKVKAGQAELAPLTGDDWSAAHVGLVLAGGHLDEAASAIGSGQYAQALRALESVSTLLDTDGQQIELTRSGALAAGTVSGHPYIGNAHAVYLFVRPEHGGGLMSVYDRSTGRSMLQVDSRNAPLWQAAVKHADGGSGFDNVNDACSVEADVNGAVARLKLRWATDINVVVDASLNEGDALLRSRIQVKTARDDHGLLTVTFPTIAGIKPFSAGAKGDVVLETWGLGWEKPSPLVSASTSSTDYPRGMQFSALIGAGHGLYVAEQDPTAARKALTWSPDTAAGTVDYAVSHPVLNWGARKPVHIYESPGDVVVGPFTGDWFDAAQIYRRWAVTAPWARKGPIHQRKDYPQWLGKVPYFTIGYLGDEHDIQQEYDKHAFYDVPLHVAHTYNYYFMQHMDDRYPEHFPPKLGSENFRRVVKELQDAGIMIVPYVNGWVWDVDTESYRTEQAARNGALWNKQNKVALTMTSYGGGQSLVGMCPGSPLWRQQLTKISFELVGRYGAAGIYYDFLTVHTSDCYNAAHNHPICGGNFWTQAVRDLYTHLRTEMKQLDPDVTLTGEDHAEWVIDLLDTGLEMGKVGTTAPLFLAVYKGYTNVFGGHSNSLDPTVIGRTFLLGMQNGWYGPESSYATKEEWAHLGVLYRKLIRCHWHFGQPYLSTGRMLRPPKVHGADGDELPILTGPTPYGDYAAVAVEASAFLAPDGSVGVFILNHEDKPHHIEWSIDLNEIVGIDASRQLKITTWTEDGGETGGGETPGGVITRATTIEPRGLIALRLEDTQ